MAKKRIIAHCMHEAEVAAAKALMPGGEATESYVVGDVDDAQIPLLRKAGILVQEIDLEEPLSRMPDEGLGLRVAAPGGDVGFEGGAPAPASLASGYYRLSLSGPLLPQRRGQLERAGVRIRESLPGFRLRVKASPEKLATIRDLSFVRSLELETTERPRAGARPKGLGVGPSSPKEPVSYDVLLDEPAHLNPFLAWLQAKGVSVIAAEGDKVRIVVLEGASVVDEISQLTSWVGRIERYVEPELHNDAALQILGVSPQGNPGPALPYEGAGEIVAVADTGLDQTHPDFAGRVAAAVPLGRPGDASDPHGHGTHVAGSAVGDGSGSAGRLRGAAPKATLYFQSLLDGLGRLGGLPFRLGTLFGDAYAAGARIHNNSWGAATASSYRVNSDEVDEFVHTHKDMLIVISAGNEGTAADPAIGTRNAPKGFVDWLSIGSPATAKNALVVGASRSSRTAGGFAALTYGSAWPGDFPDPPMKNEPISGQPESVSGFSSRGPCDDYRIKPDVVAPGTDILSCRSSLAPLRNFWGPDPANSRYAYMGGTSMAAPLATGCAALVREYFVKTRGHSPSAALLKATLVNGTRWLGGPDAIADFPNLPNYHQGFGCISVPSAIPHPANPAFRLEFFDNWQAAPSHFTVSGQRKRFQFSLGAGASLRLCLAYTDPPGRAVQNNLNLLLEVPGTNQKRFGNEQVPRGFNGPDPTNNVEVLRIENAQAGNYLVQIVAANLLKPQDFALVITGRLTTPLVEV